jgi:hypothetical protein
MNGVTPAPENLHGYGQRRLSSLHFPRHDVKIESWICSDGTLWQQDAGESQLHWENVMAEENLPVRVGPPAEDKGFEQLKSVNKHGVEYWSARDLQPLLGYHHWRNFEKAVAKAITSCQQSGNEPDHHFARAQNDRVGQRWTAERGRLLAIPFRLLPDRPERRPSQAGDRSCPELAANQFRMTQTREKLAKEGIQGQTRAIDTHRQVGKEVREAIRRIGGTMPERLPPAEPIKQVEKRLKDSPPHLELDGPDAKGLTGPEQKK